jgi:hypothetical protein
LHGSATASSQLERRDRVWLADRLRRQYADSHEDLLRRALDILPRR